LYNDKYKIIIYFKYDNIYFYFTNTKLKKKIQHPCVRTGITLVYFENKRKEKGEEKYLK